jgi:hypothetical protein
MRAPALRSPARHVRYVFCRLNTLTYSTDKEAWAEYVKYFLAQRVRVDQRRVEGVEVGGGLPGSGAGEGRSLLAD